jgi:hypothetical protein
MYTLPIKLSATGSFPEEASSSALRCAAGRSGKRRRLKKTWSESTSVAAAAAAGAGETVVAKLRADAAAKGGTEGDVCSQPASQPASQRASQLPAVLPSSQMQRCAQTQQLEPLCESPVAH